MPQRRPSPARASLVLSILGALSLTTAASAQMRPSFAPKRFDLPPAGATMPIELIHGIPVVEGTIDGKGPFRFVVDTGAPALVISDTLAKTLSLPPPPGIPAGLKIMANSGGDGPGVPATFVHVRRLGLGAAELQDIMTIALELPGVVGFDGIVGMGLFKSCLMTLDYPADRFVLRTGALDAADADVLSYATRHQPGSLPVVPIEMNGRTLDITIDTGMSAWFMIDDEIASAATFAYGPVDGPRSRMVDVESATQVGRLDGTVGIGPYAITGALVSVRKEEREPSIGTGCLKQFVLTFDQQNELVRFARRDDGPIIAPACRVVGFDIDRTDDRYVIGSTIPGSPASRAGLTVNEEIVAVNGTPIGTIHGTAAWEALSDRESVTVRMRGTNGKTRDVTVEVYEMIPPQKP